jgi:hypothetical protein
MKILKYIFDVVKCSNDVESTKSHTVEYLNSAIKFFEDQYKCKVNCDIKYHDSQSLFFKGVYSPDENTIDIYGLSLYDKKQVVTTLFHELVHYWQHKVVKTLHSIPMSEFGIPEFCQIHGGYSNSKINNYRDVLILFNDIDTTRMPYEDKPHEIEARELSEKLNNEFERTNDEKQSCPTRTIGCIKQSNFTCT